MPTFRLNANKFAILRYRNQTANDHTSQIATAQTVAEPDFVYDAVLFGIESFPQQYRFNRIVSVTVSTYSKNVYSYESIDSDFDQNTANYYNAFSKISRSMGYNHDDETYYKRHELYISYSNADSYNWNAVMEALHYGFAVELIYYGEFPEFTPSVYTSASSQKPYIEVTVSDETATPLVYAGSPSGNVDRRKPITFNWSFDQSYTGNVYGRFTPSSVEFKWRALGATTWNTVSLGAVTKYVMPENTLPSGNIEWTVEATSGTATITAAPKTINTTEPAPSVTAKEPKDAIINRDVETVLKWNYSISSQSLQYAYEVEGSEDGATWTPLSGKVLSSETSYTVAPRTINAGNWQWRVRAYNGDDVASGWSVAGVTVIGSPDTPDIRFEDITPKISFTWFTQEQQGYEIRIDGEIIKSAYGTEMSFQYDGWLADGNHTVEVRVQNSYGLWSEWGSESVSIQNDPELSIELEAEENYVSWTAGYDRYIVYRNSNPVAVIAGNEFLDPFASGEVSYQVRGFNDDSGNYALSNTVTVQVSYESLTVYDVETGSVIDLGRSARQTRQINIVIDKDVTFTHYSGHEFPAAERGISVDRRCTFEFAFLTSDPLRSEAESIVGHTVALHNAYKETIVGVISSLRKTEDEFICSYTATLTRTEYDEVEINARLQLPN